MDEGLNYLQTFNPIESKAELLEKTLIGRKALVDQLESLVIDSAFSGNKHQRLIIGPRGSGKTHLLRVLYNRIAGRDELKGKLKIAYLCEDEYGIANFLDFIIRIFRAFLKWDPANSRYLENEIDRLKKIPPHDQEKKAKEILLKHIEGNTLLIIAENIGDIFNAIEEKGQRKLRDLVQQYPHFSIMASNQALFKDIQDVDKPFHNFFKITHLKKLTLEEVILFLKSIAQWEEKTDLLKFLDQPEGRGRIHAIFDITGGNHRLLVTFYNFLKIDYKNDLSSSFIKTINDLIPYYQSFMNLLSAQQQKIIQYLCQNRKPSSVKDIAENCFSTPNTISKQVSTLEKLKYVDATSSGKETFYELSEPLLRICFEVKENRGGPVKLFIDFLGNLYTVQEVKEKYMRFTGDTGDIITQIETAKQLLKKNKNDIDAILLLADAFQKNNDFKKSDEKFNGVLKFDEKNITALNGLGVNRMLQEKYKEAEQYFLKVIALEPDTDLSLRYAEFVAGNQGRDDDAFSYFEKLTKLKPGYSINWVLLRWAYYFKIVSCRLGLNDIAKALSQLEKALNLAKENKLSWPIIQNFEENYTTLFIQGSKENVSTYLRESLLLIERYGYIEELFKALPQAFFKLLIQHEKIESNRFEWIEILLNETFKDNPAMTAALKFLNIGIRHLKKKEKNVLFQLTKEERKTFREFVLDRINKFIH